MNIAIIIIAALGIIFLLLAISRLRRRKLLAAGGHTLSGLLMMSIAGLFGAIGINLHTYERLTYEQSVAELSFKQIAPGQYQAHLRLPSGKTRLFDMEGDEWQLDARVLKWKGLATIAGMDSQYRLERISGRHHDISRERNGPRTVHTLATDAGVDLWQIAQRNKQWLPWVDATYGSATYLPMADGAQYQVRLTASGLLARPSNPNAENAVRGWR